MWQQMGREERRKMGIVLGMTLIYGCVLGSQFYVARLVNALGGSATHAGLLLILSVLPVFGVAEPALGINGVFWLPMLLSLMGLVLAGRLPAAAAGNAAPSQHQARPANPVGLRGKILEIFILMGVLGLAFGVPLQFVPMWLAKAPDMTFSPAYFLTSSFFTIMLTRLLFSHCLSGRHESWVVTACFVVVTLAIAVLGQARTPAEFVACAIAYGGAYSLLYPSCTAYLLQQADAAERAAWSNWVLLAYEVGSRCLPAIFGMIADHGGFPLAFLVLAAVIATAGAWHVMKRRQPIAVPV